MKPGDLVIQIKGDVITGAGSYGLVDRSLGNAYVDINFKHIVWVDGKIRNFYNYRCRTVDVVLMENCPKILRVMWGIS
jgi:hypothetical protein